MINNQQMAEPLKQGLQYYASMSQTPTAASSKFQSMNLPPRGDATSQLSRTKKGLKLGDGYYAGMNESTGRLNRGRNAEFDESGSLFNYMPKGTSPAKSTKSILYKMHSKPRKTLNILNEQGSAGGSRYGSRGGQDVQRFNEDFDTQSVKSMVSINTKLSVGSKPPMMGLGNRPRTQAGGNPLDALRNRLTRSIDRNPEGDSASVVADRVSSHHRRGDSNQGLRDQTIKKLQRLGSRDSLIEQIKSMNSNQLEKISKYLNVRTEAGDQLDEIQEYADMNPTASIISNTEADELNDKVEELQNALLQDQNFNDDAMSRTSSKLSLSSSLRVKNNKGPLSQAGSSLTRLSQIQMLRSEIENEKVARLNLERELGELRKVSTEINRHLISLKPKPPVWAMPTAGVPIRN